MDEICVCHFNIQLYTVYIYDGIPLTASRMTSSHHVGQSIASGPHCFFFRALEPENLWLKRAQFQMENPGFLGTLEWFCWFMLVRNHPQSFRHQRFTHFSAYLESLIPVAGIWSQGAALSVNGDLVKFISFYSLSSFLKISKALRHCKRKSAGRNASALWRMVCPLWMVKNQQIWWWTHPEPYHRYHNQTNLEAQWPYSWPTGML